jgi:hypothetical protein
LCGYQFELQSTLLAVAASSEFVSCAHVLGGWLITDRPPKQSHFFWRSSMIALVDHSRQGWHPAFLAMLPTIRAQAKIAFHDLQGDNHDDAVQETVANACVAFARLVHRGQSNAAFPTVLARFAIAQVRAGRQVGSSLNVRDVLSRYAQHKKRFVVERLDRKDRENESWIEAVVEDPHTSVFEQVWFRIDFPEWLSRLIPRNRRVAESLALGIRRRMWPSESARRLRVFLNCVANCMNHGKSFTASRSDQRQIPERIKARVGAVALSVSAGKVHRSSCVGIRASGVIVGVLLNRPKESSALVRPVVVG